MTSVHGGQQPLSAERVLTTRGSVSTLLPVDSEVRFGNEAKAVEEAVSAGQIRRRLPAGIPETEPESRVRTMADCILLCDWLTFTAI